MNQEIMRRAIKYILLFIFLLAILYYLPTVNLNNDIYIIAIVGTILYAIVDMYFPSIYIHNNNK